METENVTVLELTDESKSLSYNLLSASRPNDALKQLKQNIQDNWVIQVSDLAENLTCDFQSDFVLLPLYTMHGGNDRITSIHIQQPHKLL